MKLRKEVGLAILLLLLCIVVSVLNPRFLSEANIQNTARLIGMYGIFSLGLGVVIITGGIDLSVGSLMALLGVLLSLALTDWGWSPALALLATLAVAAALGLLHGVLIARLRLQPFIVTLCGLLFYRGLARFVARDETRGFSGAESIQPIADILSGTLLGVPTSFLFLIVLAAIMGVVLHRSVYGRHLFALGHNEEAARYSGIRTQGITISAYVLSALLGGIASIFVAFYTSSISPSSHGSYYELYGIAAAVLGGCSLRGGEGSVLGILIGTALLQVLQNLVNLLGIPSSLNFAVMGAVILLGVVADQLFSKGKR
ncbi:MAG: ABC transporter permease [Armatimonadaceae bacterium]